MLGINRNTIVNNFRDTKSFSRQELFAFFKRHEPDLNEGTFTWRIFDLKEKNIIKAVQRGQYAISAQPIFEPSISKQLTKLARAVTTRFGDVKHCLWTTAWTNEFSNHQVSQNWIIIEIEKDFAETLFYALKDTFSLDFFLEPDEKTIDLYVSACKHPVIIKKMITRSPTSARKIKRLAFNTPQLEKILVDLYADHKLFYFYQGSEMIHVFENAIKIYPINYTTLFSYAARRGNAKDLKQFLGINLPHVTKEFIQ